MMAGRASAGHPVDVSSGEMYVDLEDIVLPGAHPLALRRHYGTGLLASPDPSPLGPGWTFSFWARLTREGGEYRFLTPDGSMAVFPDPDGTVARGGIVRLPGAFMEIARQGMQVVVTQWDSEEEEVTRYVFVAGRNGEYWPLRAIEDAAGRGLDLAWDDRGMLKGVRQRLEKRTLVFSHSGEGKLASVAFLLPDGRQEVLARYEYDRMGRLSAACDALGRADRYEYDAAGRMLREIAKDGGVFSFRYDEDGRCLRTSGLDGYDLKVLRYMPHIGWTEVVNSRGETTRYQCLPSGQVQKVISALGHITETLYDEHGRIAGEIDPAGNATRITYDEAGNVETETDAAGGTVRYAWNARRQRTLVVDAAGNEWKREYDASGNMVLEADPEGNRTEYGYDSAGNLTSIRDPKGSEMRIACNERGEETAVTDRQGRTSLRKAYDPFGRVTRMADARGGELRIAYSPMGRITDVRWPDGTATRFEYDAGGNLVAAREEDGRVRRYLFGPCGRLLESSSPEGRKVLFKWGSEPGQLLECVNGNGESYRFEYDAEGRLAAEIGYDGSRRTYGYDPAGRCVSVTDASGNVTEDVVDARGDLLARKFADGTEFAFDRDAMGRIVQAATPDCTLKRRFDSLGRLLSEEVDGEAVEYEYDAGGNLARISTTRDFQVGYAYDADDELTGVAATGLGDAIAIRRDEKGAEVARILPGRAEIRSEYGADGGLVSRSLAREGAPLSLEGTPPGSSVSSDGRWEHAFRYDASGILVGETAGGLECALDHDRDGNLVGRGTLTGRYETFRYDGDGNIAGSSTDDWSYLPGGRLGSRPGVEYEYDAVGRLAKRIVRERDGDAAWTFEYNGDGLMSRVRRPDGTLIEYGYDALARRVWKRMDGAVTRYLWSGDVLIQEIRPDGSAVGYVFEPDSFEPLADVEEGKARCYLNDALGIPRAIYSASDGSLRTLDFGALGSLAGAEGEPVPFRFPGQYHDPETGLHYNRHRYYDPETGRFTTPDPAGLDAGPNLYRYAPDPFSWLDPFGLDVTKNKKDGTKREKQRGKELKKLYPQDSVQNEQYLRDSDGKIVKVNGSGRRVDFVVISEDGSRVRRLEEVTSTTADKTKQRAKEQAIRAKGGVFIRDRRTRKLVRIGARQRIHCTRM
jgi:RHS repeat-associated protein